MFIDLLETNKNLFVRYFQLEHQVAKPRGETSVFDFKCKMITNVPCLVSGGSKGGYQGRTPPLSAKISSFSCSFQEKLGK